MNEMKLYPSQAGGVQPHQAQVNPASAWIQELINALLKDHHGLY